MTTSIPYGRPPVFSSIQVSTVSSSAGSLKRTQPRTPRPPARLTAAATCSDGVKPTMGCSMPSRSQSGVRTVMTLRGPLCGSGGSRGMLGDVRTRPAVISLTGHGPADGVHEPDGPRHLVAGQLAVHVSLQRGGVRGSTGAKRD